MDTGLRPAEGVGKIVIRSYGGEELSRQIMMSSTSGPSTSKAKAIS